MFKKILTSVLSLGLIFTLTGCSSTDVGKLLDIADKVLNEETSDYPYDDYIDESPDDNSKQNSSVSTTYVTNEEVITYTYQGDPWVYVDDGKADFTASEISEAQESYQRYSELDSLGRCGEAMASVGNDIMPTEKRGSISSVKPSGWVNAKYDNVEGKYLYNRCHLIGYQLTGVDTENAELKQYAKLDLITGTRYLNIQGMLDWENLVAKHVKGTDNHVLYRVTPLFEGENLVANGVRMEGYSVEDNGASVNFDVYAFNVQPGITIDYATGNSHD